MSVPFFLLKEELGVLLVVAVVDEELVTGLDGSFGEETDARVATDEHHLEVDLKLLILELPLS